MCKSVPQMPVFSTRMRTSLMPIWGTGASRRARPGFASALTKAFIVFIDCPTGFTSKVPEGLPYSINTGQKPQQSMIFADTQGIMRDMKETIETNGFRQRRGEALLRVLGKIASG